MAIVKNSIPYAKALFDLAKEKNQIKTIKADVIALKDVCEKSADFKDFISNPTIANDKKIDILKNLFSNKVQNETLEFLLLLVRKGRLNQLASVCEAAIHFFNQEENIIQVRLTTATAISDNEKSSIASQFLGDKKFEMENVVNPSIIGGFVLEFDNKILDNSISNQIKTIKNNIIK